MFLLSEEYSVSKKDFPFLIKMFCQSLFSSELTVVNKQNIDSGF